MSSVIIYTDGSCSNGSGGWCFVAIEEESKERTWVIILSNNEINTTSNRMELRAVIEALKNCKNYDSYHIYSDSLYIINGANGKNKRVKNNDLWDEYDKVSNNKNIKYSWVKSHSGDYYNELVDKYAKQEARQEIVI